MLLHHLKTHLDCTNWKEKSTYHIELEKLEMIKISIYSLKEPNFGHTKKDGCYLNK